MTVYSKAISGNVFSRQTAFDFNKTQQASAVITPVFKLNFFLLVVASLMLLTYIFLSNFVISQKYALNLEKSEFNQLSAAIVSGSKEVSNKQDLSRLMGFAQKFGMIEAKDTGVILEDSSFALSR